MSHIFFLILIVIVTFTVSYSQDWRNINNGYEIPTHTYADQSFIVKTNDGAWLCCVTTGAGKEGQKGQHIISMRSFDCGKTWQDKVAVEPAGGPEASYSVMLKSPNGRIFIFYNHNTDNVRQLKADITSETPHGMVNRVDTQGYYVFKFSNDNGMTWSKDRFPIPVRAFEIDKENPYQGKIRFFWNVGKPFIHDDNAYVPLIKVGRFGKGYIARSEGVLLKSDNLLSESNPEKINWETLPKGDIGLRTPGGGGPISEEQSYVILSDGSFYCVYRSIDGHPVFSYSRDSGDSWDPPQYKRFANGKLVKHPRAANFVWKCSNGNYLYWFHNHGGKWYDDRNPAWLCGGIEFDTPQGKKIKWSQPEIVLYDDDPYIRMSYPDLVEDDGKYYLTETQKHIARVHEIDKDLVEGLWNQIEKKSLTKTGLVLELPENSTLMQNKIEMPALPHFVTKDANRADHGIKKMNAGFTIELWMKINSLKENQIILDNRNKSGKGFCLKTTGRQTIEIVLNDGRTENRWDCDQGILQLNKLLHIAVVVDGGPKIITFIVDGIVCDGDEYRQFGWGRFSPNLRDVNGDKILNIGSGFSGEIKKLRIYNRYLRISEVVGNFNYGI